MTSSSGGHELFAGGCPERDDDTQARYWAVVVDSWHRDRLPVWATPGARGRSVLSDLRPSQPGESERNRAFAEMAARVARDISDDGTLTHDGSTVLRVDVHNARRRPNQWGVTLGKENQSSRRLLDLAVCMVGARLGRKFALDSGLTERKRLSQLYAF